MNYDPNIPITTAPAQGEFRRKLLSTAGLSAFTPYTSSARQVMFTNSHLAQKIVTAGMQERYLQTGMEYEFGRATFSVKMPCDGRILQIFEVYPTGDSVDSIKENPEFTVIYEDIHTKEVGMLSLPKYFSFHSYFGFPYEPGKGAEKLIAGYVIPKDTIFLDSPGKNKETGNYAYGVNLNLAFMSHPAISEDGIVISRDVLPKFRFKRYETRSIEWGDKTYALNLFGDEKNYKICPDIGEYVREDGLIMALRTYDEKLAPVDMNVNALRRVDYAHDERIYANGPGGKIIDIRVTTNFDITQELSDMDKQMEKYINQRIAYYRKIITMYEQLRRGNKALQLSRPLHSLIVKAYTELATGKNRLNKLYRKTPLDLFRVDFVIEYDILPNIGFKYTECYGG